MTPTASRAAFSRGFWWDSCRFRVLQFVAAWAAARLVRGNLLAALLGTFNTNPLTTPFFAVFAMSFGPLDHGRARQLDL